MRRPKVYYRKPIPVNWHTPCEETWEELVRCVARNTFINILSMRMSVKNRYPAELHGCWSWTDRSTREWAGDFIERMVADMPDLRVPLAALTIEADARYQLRIVKDEDGRYGLEILCLDVEHEHTEEPLILATFWEMDWAACSVPLEDVMDAVTAHHRIAER